LIIHYHWLDNDHIFLIIITSKTIFIFEIISFLYIIVIKMIKPNMQK